MRENIYTTPPLYYSNDGVTEQINLDQRELRRNIGDMPVRITGAPDGGTPGLYPAIRQRIQEYDSGTGVVWEDEPDGDCWAVAMPSQTLATGLYAESTFLNRVHDSKPIVSVRSYAGGGGVETQNTDASGNVDPTSTLSFDRTTGIEVDTTGAAAGENIVKGIAATASQQGVVSTSAQTFAGAKTFNNTVRVATEIELPETTYSGIIRAHPRVPTSSSSYLGVPLPFDEILVTASTAGSLSDVRAGGSIITSSSVVGSDTYRYNYVAAGSTFLEETEANTIEWTGFAVWRWGGSITTFYKGIDVTISPCKTYTVTGGIVTGEGANHTEVTPASGDKIVICRAGVPYLVDIDDLTTYIETAIAPPPP